MILKHILTGKTIERLNTRQHIFFGEVFAIGHVHLPDRQRETKRQKARNHPPGGMATPQSLLLYSPFGILGTHAHTHAWREFKPLGPGRDSNHSRLLESPAT